MSLEEKSRQRANLHAIIRFTQLHDLPPSMVDIFDDDDSDLCAVSVIYQYGQIDIEIGTTRCTLLLMPFNGTPFWGASCFVGDFGTIDGYLTIGDLAWQP